MAHPSHYPFFFIKFNLILNYYFIITTAPSTHRETAGRRHAHTPHMILLLGHVTTEDDKQTLTLTLDANQRLVNRE